MHWNGKELKSYGEIIETALKLQGKPQEDFVATYRKTGPFALQNIGYFAGYYDRETQLEVYKVFGTSHPVFGTRQPTQEEALEAGKRVGESFKKR